MRKVSEKRGNPISRLQHEQEIAKMYEFFRKIWDKRQHRCESCGNPLGTEIKSYFFDHLLEKSDYPEYQFYDSNIFLCCLECHSLKTSGFPLPKHRKAINIAKEELLNGKSDFD